MKKSDKILKANYPGVNLSNLCGRSFDNFDLETIIIAFFTRPFLSLYIVIEKGIRRPTLTYVFQKNGVYYSIISTRITVTVKLGK